jgi:hypothetical protein
MADAHIWPVAAAIHRNETYWLQPLRFIPERHLPQNHAWQPFPDAPVHKDSFRPFEKGPRNCIGQELAMLETKIILALTVREFDFVAEFPEVVGKEGKAYPRGGAEWDGVGVETVEEDGNMVTIEGHRCYQILKGSAKPASGMPGRVYLRPQQESAQ